ncbi:hypothetical protein PT276_06650 [Orbaceae bacterium ESL0721]|nr:hypothetical protein [Orbaceae bacterium ESL0721]
MASKELLQTKPIYSRVPNKWIEEGGKIEILDNNWTYINKDGISVTYELKNINGKDVKLPNFSRYLHPDKKMAEVDIGVFSGNRDKDTKKFLEQ